MARRIPTKGKISMTIDEGDERAFNNMIEKWGSFPKELAAWQDARAELTVKQMKKDALLMDVYDTGRLYRNIEYVPHLNVRNNVSVEFKSEAIDPETGKDYAPLQVFGFRYQRPRDYFHPNVRKYFQDMGQVVPKWLNELAKRGNKKIGYLRFFKYKGQGR